MDMSQKSLLPQTESARRFLRGELAHLSLFSDFFCVTKRRPLKLLDDKRRKKCVFLSMETERSRFLYVDLQARPSDWC